MQSSFSIDSLRRFLYEKLRRHAAPGATSEGTADSDLSYEDALLDLQIGNYLKAEYGHAQPQSAVFPRLLAAIRAHEQKQTTTRGPLPVTAFMALYRALHSPAAGKLVSSGIAAVVMIAVLSSNSAQFTRGTAVSFVAEESTPTPSIVHTGENATDLATQRDERFVIRIRSIAAEPAFYDPAERRTPGRPGLASGRSTPVLWQRFGGQ
jgi:hypothetical protein